MNYINRHLNLFTGQIFSSFKMIIIIRLKEEFMNQLIIQLIFVIIIILDLINLFVLAFFVMINYYSQNALHFKI